MTRAGIFITIYSSEENGSNDFHSALRWYWRQTKNINAWGKNNLKNDADAGVPKLCSDCAKPCPDGRKCKTCPHRDNQFDPVAKHFGKEEYMAWANNPNIKTGKTDSLVVEGQIDHPVRNLADSWKSDVLHLFPSLNNRCFTKPWNFRTNI